MGYQTVENYQTILYLPNPWFLDIKPQCLLNSQYPLRSFTFPYLRYIGHEHQKKGIGISKRTSKPWFYLSMSSGTVPKGRFDYCCSSNRSITWRARMPSRDGKILQPWEHFLIRSSHHRSSEYHRSLTLYWTLLLILY